jgi:hypothetical protein
MPPTSAARLQEAALDANVNARFGRMELATERISAKLRADFLKHRAAWGNKIRVADSELAGVSLKDDDHAEVLVRVAWFRPEEGELRVTTLHQNWTQDRDDWKMTSEERHDGDIGLIGEPVPPAPERTEPVQHAQFPTIRIGAED